MKASRSLAAAVLAITAAYCEAAFSQASDFLSDTGVYVHVDQALKEGLAVDYQPGLGLVYSPLAIQVDDGGRELGLSTRFFPNSSSEKFRILGDKWISLTEAELPAFAPQFDLSSTLNADVDIKLGQELSVPEEAGLLPYQAFNFSEGRPSIGISTFSQHRQSLLSYCERNVGSDRKFCSGLGSSEVGLVVPAGEVAFWNMVNEKIGQSGLLNSEKISQFSAHIVLNEELLLAVGRETNYQYENGFFDVSKATVVWSANYSPIGLPPVMRQLSATIEGPSFFDLVVANAGDEININEAMRDFFAHFVGDGDACAYTGHQGAYIECRVHSSEIRPSMSEAWLVVHIRFYPHRINSDQVAIDFSIFCSRQYDPQHVEPSPDDFELVRPFNDDEVKALDRLRDRLGSGLQRIFQGNVRVN